MKTEREAAGEEIILEIKQKVLGESYQPLRMWEGEESRILSIGRQAWHSASRPAPWSTTT